MAEVAGKREVKPQANKQKKSWAHNWLFSISNKRKRKCNLVEYAKA